MEKIGIVGAGLIGSSWSAIFSSKGFNVVVYDNENNVENKFKKRVLSFLEELKFIDNKINIENSLQNIEFVNDLNYVTTNCTFIQDCSPEIVEIKQELFSKLDNSCSENVILSSSSSGMPISLITQNLKGKNRCIISHPVNPPHLIPCVEISPSSNTSDEVIKKTKDIFQKIGLSIVYVKKEIDGFILNRLQGALLNEAVKLYSEGYASSDHIDSTVRNGLGLRWAFMGPFETIDLNAPGGIKDYMKRYGNMYLNMEKNNKILPDWSETNALKLEKERREILPDDQLLKRAQKRNDMLKFIRKLKKDMNEEIFD